MARDAVLLRDQKLLETIDKEYKSRLHAKGLTNNPFQGMGYATLVQFPWTLTMFLSLRDMISHPEIAPGFASESGFLWCPSMALPDPYGILPLISSLMVLRTLNRSLSSGSSPPSANVLDPTRMKFVICGATLTFAPFLMQLPCGIVLFFIMNTTFNRLVTPIIHKYCGVRFR